MDENPLLNIFYSRRAIDDAREIKGYLLYKFTQREVDNFYKLLHIFEKVVTAFRHLYPQSVKSNNIRRAVLSRQLSVFYKISDNQIDIVAILDNRMDSAKWP